MKNKIIFILCGLVCLHSCEKISVDDVQTPKKQDEASIIFRVSLSNQPTTSSVVHRAKVNAKDVCTRIGYAVFNGDTKVKAANQVVGDDDFGTLSLSLPFGEYRFVVVAHSGLGNATIASPDKISFNNNKCTDTFCTYQELSVKEDMTLDVTLKRVVGKVEFVVQDPIPSDVEQMKFYYTGGSSTLDAVTGYGCVNSKQTEYRNVLDEMRQGGGSFELFTFPHAEKDTLKLTVTALTSEDKIVEERSFPAIPVIKNGVTEYTGNFFGSSVDEGELDYHFEVDTTWVQLSKYSY